MYRVYYGVILSGFLKSGDTMGAYDCRKGVCTIHVPVEYTYLHGYTFLENYIFFVGLDVCNTRWPFVDTRSYLLSEHTYRTWRIRSL